MGKYDEIRQKNYELFTQRTIRIAGLKPSDYFLFKQEREFFGLDGRALITLGLRWIYAGMHEERMKEMIFSLAKTVREEDLNSREPEVTYTEIKRL